MRLFPIGCLAILALLTPAASPTAEAAGEAVTQKPPAPEATATLRLAQSSLPPGSDLTRVTSQAADGATITLGAGAYPGVILAQGKSLVIKGDPGGGTVLTGADAQMIVQAVDGGRLELSHVTFEPRAGDGLAAYVAKAEASFADCHVKESASPAFYVDGGRVALVRCELRGLQDVGLAATNRSTVAVRDSLISGAAKGGILLVGESRGTATGTRFEKVGGQVIRVSEGSSVTVADSHIADGKGRGVVVAGGAAEISGTRFENLADIGVLGAGGARIAVSRSEFTTLPATAIHMQQGERLAVEESEFRNVGGAVFTGEGRTAVTIEGNEGRGLQGDAPAFTIQTSGRLEIRNNLVVEAGAGIVVQAESLAAMAEISGNRLIKIRGPGMSLSAAREGGGPGIRLSGNRVLGSGGSAVLLDASPASEVTGNLLLSAGGYGMAMQSGATAALEGNLLAGAKGALFVHASAGDATHLGADILIGETVAERPLRREASTARLRFVYDGEQRARQLAEAREEVLSAVNGAADDLAPVEAAVAALSVLADQVRAEAKALAAIELHSFDRVGERFAAAYSVYEDGEEIFISDPTRPTAILRPGRYTVLPHLDPRQTTEETLGPGETKVLESQIADHQVLTFGPLRHGDPTTPRPLALKQAQDMARALGGYRDAFPFDYIAVSRPGTDAPARRRALELARQALAGMQPRFVTLTGEYATASAKPYDERNEEEKAAFSKAANAVEKLRSDFILPARILAALGAESDARDLVEGVLAADLHADKRLAVAAHIENRLGILDRGALIESLTRGSPVVATWSAIHLRYFGIDTGIPVLLEALRNPGNDSLAARAARALLGVASQEVLVAMRGVVAAPWNADRTFAHGAMIPAAAYLLAHGNEDDHRRVSGLTLATDAAPMLTLVVRDPKPVIDYLRGSMLSFDPGVVEYMTTQFAEDLAALCPLLRDLPRRDRFGAYNALEDAFIDLFVQFNLSGRGPGSDAKSGRTLYSLYASQCIASGSTAAVAYEKNDVFLRFQKWIPRPWAREETIKNPWYWNNSRLDLMAHPALADAVTRHHPTASEKRELFLAYHAVAKNVGIDNLDRLPNGAERRAVLVTNPDDPPGALAAVVAVRPEIIDDKLRVSLSFDLASHTQSSLATMISPPKRSFQQYLATRGKTLIKSVSARREGRVTPLVASGEDGDGGFVYQAEIAPGDLRNLELDVVLQIFETEWPLTVGLYASDYGRALNGALQEVARTRSAAAAEPGNPDLETAWADALRAAGRLGEARRRYEAVLSGQAGNVDLWFKLSEMYRERGLHAEAVSVLQAAVAAVPEDADLWFELANSLYLSGDYAPAGEAFAELARLEAEGERWRWWQATNLFLAGETRSALAIYRDAPVKYQRRRTVLLRFVAASLVGDEAEIAAARALVERTLAGREEMTEGLLYRYVLQSATLEEVFAVAKKPAEQCQAHVYGGYGYLLSGNRESAIERLESALAICPLNRLEYRFAAAELGRMREAR